MRIFEKDLFNFIFHPKLLSFYKSSFIKRHTSKFKDELLILLKTFETLNDKISSPILNKIKKKIIIADEETENIERQDMNNN